MLFTNHKNRMISKKNFTDFLQIFQFQSLSRRSYPTSSAHSSSLFYHFSLPCESCSSAHSSTMSKIFVGKNQANDGTIRMTTRWWTVQGPRIFQNVVCLLTKRMQQMARLVSSTPGHVHQDNFHGKALVVEAETLVGLGHFFNFHEQSVHVQIFHAVKWNGYTVVRKFIGIYKQLYHIVTMMIGAYKMFYIF